MKNRKGFSLLELLIALGIITIVSGGVFLAFRQTPRRALNNASIQLQADLRYAQRRAIQEGRRIGIIFEPAHNRYRIMSTSPTEEIRVVYFQGGVRLRQTIPGARLDFLPRGTASSGFTISLSNGRYWQRLTATVSGGRIEIFDITY
ncbi:MAG: GspH/FimT family pseudopilin [Defluviitaleaceae bacterium]|nr:GspH/FimT family pseudopilin [Defluviitaleaceae bacterium]